MYQEWLLLDRPKCKEILHCGRSSRPIGRHDLLFWPVNMALKRPGRETGHFFNARVSRPKFIFWPFCPTRISKHWFFSTLRSLGHESPLLHFVPKIAQIRLVFIFYSKIQIIWKWSIYRTNVHENQPNIALKDIRKGVKMSLTNRFLLFRTLILSLGRLIFCLFFLALQSALSLTGSSSKSLFF